jgi:DNA-binding Lrp family transcriptional regulator
LKDIEFKLISELMTNSRRSDRELAKAVGVSQPTASRIIKKLEKEGVLREYTVIPDFAKIGFELMSITFAKLKELVSEEKLMEIRKQVRQAMEKEPTSTIATLSGIGCNADRVIVAFHENYSAYTKYIDKLKQHPLVAIERISSFIIDMNDRSQYRLLTLSSLADYIICKKLQKTKEKPRKFRQPTSPSV